MSIKAAVKIHPHSYPGWKGWALSVQNTETKEMWHRLFYYKLDAQLLREDIKNMSLDEILSIYGTHYFVKVK